MREDVTAQISPELGRHAHGAVLRVQVGLHLPGDDLVDQPVILQHRGRRPDGAEIVEIERRFHRRQADRVDAAHGVVLDPLARELQQRGGLALRVQLAHRRPAPCGQVLVEVQGRVGGVEADRSAGEEGEPDGAVMLRPPPAGWRGCRRRRRRPGAALGRTSGGAGRPSRRRRRPASSPRWPSGPRAAGRLQALGWPRAGHRGPRGPRRCRRCRSSSPGVPRPG
jgi:hypothetical protein